MANQTIEARRQGNFPSQDPTRALIQDHDYIKQLMQRYLSTEDQQVKAMAGPQICEALQMHTSLEEAVFYPKAQPLDPALVQRCEEDHHLGYELMKRMANIVVERLQNARRRLVQEGR